MRQQVTRKRQKLARRTSIIECTWSSSSSGGQRARSNDDNCCKNRDGKCHGLHTWLGEADGDTLPVNNADVASVVGRVRGYLASCDDTAVREFVCMHTYYLGYDQVGPDGGMLIKKNAKMYTYYLPDLAHMKRGLDATVAGLTFPPAPASSLQLVCTKWFFFVTGLCLDKVYDNTLRSNIYGKQPFADARDLDVGIAIARNVEGHQNRAKPHTDSTISFLTTLAEMSEIMPHQHKAGKPVRVLPTRTHLMTHRLYVFGEEKRAGAPWAQAQEKELYQQDVVPAEVYAAKDVRAEAKRNPAEEDKRLEDEDKAEEEEEERIVADLNRKNKAKKKKKRERRERERDQEEEKKGQQRGSDLQPISDEGEQQAEEEYHRKRKRKAKKQVLARKYRYGNKLLGRVSKKRPEFAHVARYHPKPTARTTH
jgi:hypothetical protein